MADISQIELPDGNTYDIKDANATDTKVTQTQDNSTDDNFEVLIAGSTSNTTATEEAKKTSSLVFNPSQQAITIGSRKSGSTIGLASFASGYNVEASQSCAHAEGYSTKASGGQSHAEGNSTTALGDNSHAEGGNTVAFTYYSHAEGSGTLANGNASHAEGYKTEASGNYSHAEGTNTKASGNFSHSEGGGTLASASQSHAEGGGSVASGASSHAEGGGTTASGAQSHAEGNDTTASNENAHAEGGGTTASGICSHAEGGGTTASGSCSHAEGVNTKALKDSSHVEGIYSRAEGICSHAEGYTTVAENAYSHAEGGYSTASGDYSHVEGYNTKTSGYAGHAEGNYTTVLGDYSHAEGLYTVSNHRSQHVFGEYNLRDSSSATASNRGNYVEIVGNGTSSTYSNARTLDWGGNEVLSGKLTVGTAPTNNMDVATKQYVDTGLASADEIIEITATDYDALSYAEKHNGKYYHITDRNSSNELDTKVTQTQDDSTNATYEVLLAGSTSATTATESAKKSSGLTYNPSTSVLSMSGTPSGNTDVVTKAYADGKVDKTGDTMTGDLTVEKSNGEFRLKNPNVTINTTANNGVTSSQTEGYMIKDSANNDIARFLSVQETNGDVITQIAAFNKKADGTATNNYINATIKKDGTRTYTIADPAAFRKAIGFGGSNGVNSWFSTEPSAISVASGTMVDVYEYTLSAGIYMIHYVGNWDKNATGVRIIVMDTIKASVNGGRKTANTMFLNSYASSYDGFQEHFRFIGVTGDTPFYFRAFQNSGVSLKIYPVINILKLQ